MAAATATPAATVVVTTAAGTAAKSVGMNFLFFISTENLPCPGSAEP
ncbi:Uncharacterised protein [Legionella sainthelensi]|nr:Uncharacterised protein [Legionella sainthelensi]